MNQAAPSLAPTGTIDVSVSNRSQSRDAHGLFRYFGKLAPDVTGAVLDASYECITAEESLVVDVMCGSGTTLIESAHDGLASAGFDVNPVSLLFSRVKTRSLDGDLVRSMASDICCESSNSTEIAEAFSRTRNAERWFSPQSQREIAGIRAGIRSLPESREKDALLACLLGCVRKASNASVRTGRIFYDPDSAKPLIPEFTRSIENLVSQAPETDIPTYVTEADARSLPLANQAASLTFCHPPYFALYRYSSDVLRFELEIGNFDRRSINLREIREGWKSGDVSNLDLYVADMSDVFTEAFRITKSGGALALVASNSTLGDAQLPVVDLLADAAVKQGWELAEHLERKAHHGSASYHRSARSDKVIQRDHVLIFRSP